MRQLFLWEADRLRRIPAAAAACAELGVPELSLDEPGIHRVGAVWLEVPAEESAALEPALLRPTVFGEADPRARAPAAATLLQWFDAIGALQRSAASSPEFFREAVRLVVESAGLDGAYVLQFRPDGRHVVAANLTHPEHGFAYSDLVLDAVERQRVTVFHEAELPRELNARPAIAAPIFAADQRLWGALYGFRSPHAKNRRRNIRPLEAQLLRLLADMLGAGLQRLEREAEGARQQVVLGQSFAAPVAEVAVRTPDLLRVREREVSVVFCDLRNFTSLADKLPQRQTYEILSDVMDRLTDLVLNGGGSILDYYGDGLAAFWNAPLDQPEHAAAACATALRMLEEIAAASLDWLALTERPLVGVAGIHTGLATVGNAGSRRRMKYGPRGAVVNLASRLEGAAKKFDLPLVISSATADRLGERFQPFRVGRSKLAGIRDAADLYSLLVGPITLASIRERTAYAQALTHFDAGDFDAAEDLLAAFSPEATATPWKFLLSAVQASRLRQFGRRSADKTDAGFVPRAKR